LNVGGLAHPCLLIAGNSPKDSLPQASARYLDRISIVILESVEMTREERDRMESLCKRIAVEKDPRKFEELACKLNDLISDTLKSIQPKSERTSD